MKLLDQAPEPELVEIRAMFGGVPLVFERMYEAGDLADNWPGIRAIYRDPDPLPREVVEVLLAALALRCGGDYCTALHSLGLVDETGQLGVRELIDCLTVPEEVPERARWDRLVRQAWLAAAPGPQRRAASHALELGCSPEEHARLLHVSAVGAFLASYLGRTPDCESPRLDTLPAQLRELVPEFVQFHTSAFDKLGPPRPVCTVCAACEQLRSTTDQAWYPREVIVDLIPADAVFSHGLCASCYADHDWFGR